MKKTIIILLISLSGLVVLGSPDVSQALVMFLFLGIIPGTNVAVEADRMLEIIALLTGFVLSRVTTAVIRAGTAKPAKPTQALQAQQTA